MKFEIKIDDSKLKRLAPAIGGAIRRVVQYVAEDVRNTIVLNLEGRILRVRSHRLVGAWSKVNTRARDNGANRAVVVMSPGVVYAAIHEYGGTIKPKKSNKRGLLSWRTEGGQWISRHQVTIPARRYISLSMHQAAANIPDRANRAIREAIAEHNARGGA